MSANDLSTLLLVLIGANVVLVIVAISWSQVRRRRARAVPRANRAHGDRQDDRPVADVRPVTLAPSAIGRGYSSPVAQEPGQHGREIDRLTGLLSLTDWNRLIEDENVRHARYKRTTTIVVIDLDGFDRLMTALGQIAADRVVAAVADTIRRHARKADHIARLGPSRFGALLLETDEISAINFVERVRQAGDEWLESGAISIRLAIGWASPVVDSSVVGAQAQAIERMFNEMHRGAPRDRGTDTRPTDSVPGLKGAPSAV